MNLTSLNRMLDFDDDYFAGYFSENPIYDIKEEYIGSMIDFETLNKTSRQLTISMGSLMGMINAFAAVIFREQIEANLSNVDITDEVAEDVSSSTYIIIESTLLSVEEQRMSHVAAAKAYLDGISEAAAVISSHRNNKRRTESFRTCCEIQSAAPPLSLSARSHSLWQSRKIQLHTMTTP